MAKTERQGAMKLLATLTDSDIAAGKRGEFKEKYQRNAARLVVVDQEGRVALMHTGLFRYHKLPGGGVDESEDPAVAAAREALEETGCRVDVVELGRIDELRGHSGQRQINYGYLCRVIGEKGEPQFTESEIHEQFGVQWFNIGAAIAMLKKEDHPGPDNQFMRVREIRFLEAAKLLLQ